MEKLIHRPEICPESGVTGSEIGPQFKHHRLEVTMVTISVHWAVQSTPHRSRLLSAGVTVRPNSNLRRSVRNNVSLCLVSYQCILFRTSLTLYVDKLGNALPRRISGKWVNGSSMVGRYGHPSVLMHLTRLTFLPQ